METRVYSTSLGSNKNLAREVEEELVLVNIEEINTNPNQPRKEFCEEEIEALSSSIQQIGLIHPLLVRRTADGAFELVAGERRLRASRKAGLRQIAVIVRTQSEEQSAHAALVENIQRVDLNPIEVARSFKQLASQFGLTQEELALKVGKKRSTVANYLRLLSLPEEIQLSLASGEISMGHAKAILSAGSEALQRKLWRKILSQKLTVRQAERRRDLFCDDLANRIGRAMGRPVVVQSRRGGGGRLLFDYCDFDDLDHLLERLGVADG